MSDLPPFPVDATTLDMLIAAIDPRSHGDTNAQTSNVGAFLDFMSQLGGSDPHAIAEQVAEDVVILRDPQYDVNDVVTALIAEVRRLREEGRR